MAQDPEEYRVPRNFKLLDELEAAEKGKQDPNNQYKADIGFITLGLDEDYSVETFTHWRASIIPQQGQHIGDRFYELTIVAGPDYPIIPPLIRFVHRVAIHGVADDGTVNLNQLSNQYRWCRESSIIEALVYVRKSMEPSQVAQLCMKIPNGTKYSDMKY